jgi:hypothetical protein
MSRAGVVSPPSGLRLRIREGLRRGISAGVASSKLALTSRPWRAGGSCADCPASARTRRSGRWNGPGARGFAAMQPRVAEAFRKAPAVTVSAVDAENYGLARIRLRPIIAFDGGSKSEALSDARRVLPLRARRGGCFARRGRVCAAGGAPGWASSRRRTSASGRAMESGEGGDRRIAPARVRTRGDRARAAPGGSRARAR